MMLNTFMITVFKKPWFWLLLTIYLIDPVSIMYIVKNKMAVDLRSFYYAASAVTEGLSPYERPILQALSDAAGLKDYVYPYLYPPILAMALQPLLIIPPQWISAFYLIFNTLTILLSLLLLVKLANKALPDISQQRLYVTVFFALISLPMHSNLMLGQINIAVLLFLIASFYFCYCRNQDLVAGSLLALAVLIKLTPLGFVMFFLLDKRFKVVFGFVISISCIILISLLHEDGPTLWLAFLNSVATTTANETAGLSQKVSIANISLLSVMRDVVPETMLTALFITLISVIATILLCLSFRHMHHHKHLLIMPWLSLMLLVSPILYTHHFIYLIPGVFFTALYLYPRLSITQRLLSAAAIVIMGLDWPLWNVGFGINHIITQSISMITLSLLLLSQLWMLSRLPTSIPQAES